MLIILKPYFLHQEWFAWIFPTVHFSFLLMTHSLKWLKIIQRMKKQIQNHISSHRVKKTSLHRIIQGQSYTVVQREDTEMQGYDLRIQLAGQQQTLSKFYKWDIGRWCCSIKRQAIVDCINRNMLWSSCFITKGNSYSFSSFLWYGAFLDKASISWHPSHSFLKIKRKQILRIFRPLL